MAAINLGKRFLTTYLTITGFGAHGDSGDESFKEQLFWNKICQKGTENVRKKFHQLFGNFVEIARIVPQFVRKTHFISGYVKYSDGKITIPFFTFCFDHIFLTTIHKSCRRNEHLSLSIAYSSGFHFSP